MATYSSKLYPFNKEDSYALKEHMKKKYVSKLFMEKQQDSDSEVGNSSDSSDEPKRKAMTAKKSHKKAKDFE